jgi:hypothetical protein
MARGGCRGSTREVRRGWLPNSGQGSHLHRLAEAGGELRGDSECWSTEASSDGHSELFVSPGLTEGSRILDVLAHELVHATVGTAAGHKKPFKQCALAIGLQGPMRATTASPEFVVWTGMLIERIGPYPAGYLTDQPKQSTRLVKCECSVCGYLARVSRKWLSLSGPPICPSDKITMKPSVTDDSHERRQAA